MPTTAVGVMPARFTKNGADLWRPGLLNRDDPEIARMSLRVVVIGVVLGLVGSVGVMRVLAGQLFGVSLRDPMTLVTVVLAISVAATQDGA